MPPDPLEEALQRRRSGYSGGSGDPGDSLDAALRRRSASVGDREELDAALKRRTDTWTDASLRGTAESYGDILPRTQPVESREAQQSLSGSAPGVRKTTMRAIRQHRSMSKSEQKQALKIARELQKRGGVRNRESAAALREQVNMARRSELPREPPGVSPLTHLANAIDLGAQAGRTLTAHPDSRGWDKQENAEDWVKAHREAQKRVKSGDISLKDLPSAAGMTAIDLGLSVSPLGKAGTLVGGEALGDIAAQTVVDPLTYLSGGTNQVATGMRAATRMAAKAGLKGSELVKLTRRLGQVVSRYDETAKAVPLAEKIFARAFKQAGMGADEGIAAFRSAFGEAGEFLGRSQARFHLPFAPEHGFDLAQMTGKEFAGGKAIQGAWGKAQSAVNKLSGGKAYAKAPPPLFAARNLARQAQAARRGAQGLSGVVEEEIGKVFTKSAVLAKGISPERRAWIVRNVLDPDYAGDFEPVLNSLGEVISHKPPRKLHAAWQQNYKDLSKAEKKWVASLNRGFRGAHEYLIGAGLMKPGSKGATNLVSGMYFPRMLSKTHGWMDDIQPFTAHVPTAKRGGVGGNPLGRIPTKEAAGEWYLKGEFDPMDVIPQYTTKVARSVARADLDRQLSQYAKALPDTGSAPPGWSRIQTGPLAGQMLPAPIANARTQPFDDAARTLLARHRAYVAKNVEKGGTETWGDRAVTKALSFAKTMDSQFKRYVLMPRAGYHVINITNDTLQMAADGNKAVPIYLKRAREVLKGGNRKLRLGGRTMTYDQVVREAKLEGLPLSGQGMARGEVGGAYAQTYGHKAKTRALKKLAGDKSSKWDRFKDVYDKPVEIGEKFAGAWEANAKMAHYLWRRSMGDSSRAAASRTFEVLLDYSNPNRLSRVLRFIGMPFSTWAGGAPVMAARTLARNPGAFAHTERLLQAGTDPLTMEGPDYWAERGLGYQMKPGMAKAYGKAREFLGGQEAQAGATYQFMPRNPLTEAFAMGAETLRGNLEPALLAKNPAAKFIWEMFAEKDLLTKKTMSRWTPGAFIPRGSSAAVPDALKPLVAAFEGEEGQQTLARYVPSYLVNPLYQHVFNTVMFHLGGGAEGGAPVNTMGTVRHYSDPSQPGNILAQQRMSLATGVPVQEITRGNRLTNLTYKDDSMAEKLAAQVLMRRIKKHRAR